MKQLIRLLIAATLIYAIIYVFPGCDKLITEQITIIEAGHPTAEFIVDQDSGCAPLTVQFTDKSQGPHQFWTWFFGDGDSSNVQDPIHTYDSAGTYTVSLTIRDTSVADTGIDTEVKKRFIIVGTSVKDFTVDTTQGCAGLEVTFTPGIFGAVDSFRWNFGDNTAPVNDTTPTHMYLNPGIYTVTLTAMGPCGTKIITKDSLIQIDHCPVVTIGKDTSAICAGDSIVFWDSTQIDTPYVFQSRFWNFGDTTDTGTNPTITFDTPGIYEISLTVTTDGGTTTAYDTVTVFGTPVSGFRALSPQTACKSDFQQFIVRFADTSHGDITSRIWYFGDGDTLADDSLPVHAYIEPGEYTVTLKISGPCGADEVSVDKFITLYDTLSLFDSLGTPKFSITPDSGSLLDTFVFRHTPAPTDIIANRIWTFGDTAASSSDTLIKKTYADTGHYEISLTISNSCNSVQVIDTVIVSDTIAR